MKKNIVLLLSCILVIMVGAGAVAGILTLSGKDNGDQYRKKLAAANKYVEEEKWEDAIAAYLEAIKYNDEDENAYYYLAQVYIYEDRMEDAKQILEKGIRLTNSQKLQELYDEYFAVKADSDKAEEKKSGELALNMTLLNQIASFDYRDYEKKYGMSELDYWGGKSDISHKNLPGVIFKYYNTDDNKSIINENSGEPGDDKMPCEVYFENLELLISGALETISYEELEGLGVKDLRIDYQNDMQSYAVTFETAKCQVSIACDENGNVSMTAWNQVVPKNGNKADKMGETAYIQGTIIDAVTGKGVPDAKMYIWERGGNAGDPIAEVQAERDGSYEMDLEEGEYTAEIECKDFITEEIDFEINKWGEIDMDQFVISPKLEEGQIRIVLEWGEYPSDLDSHLEGDTSTGKDIHVSYMDQVWDEANLDVDDTSSYGPETTTIFDINGTYEFYVIDFTGSGNISTSDAAVKIYVPGQTAPMTFKVPAGLENEWRVCKISNGEVTAY